MSKNKERTFPEGLDPKLQEEIKNMFDGKSGIQEGIGTLKKLSENLKMFEKGLIENPAIEKAKNRHLEAIEELLVKILREAGAKGVSLDNEESCKKLAETFITTYKKQILVPIGM